MRSVILFQPKMGYYDLVVRNIPLGLLSIARNVDGYKLIIIDQRVMHWKTALRNALQSNPLAVCFTVMTGKQIAFALDVSRIIKEERPDIPIVWGGVHPTILPEEVIKNDYIDIVVCGEADNLFPKLIRALDEKKITEVPSLWYKENGSVVSTEPAKEIVNLDSLALLPYHLINFDDYKNYAEQGLGTVVALETGRGCPCNCLFCYNATPLRQGWRSLSAERIIDHVKHLKTFIDFEGINFIDDNFFTDTQRVRKLLALMKKEELEFCWGSETGIRELKRADDALLEALVAHGLRWLSIGIESGSQRILEKINKNITIEEVTETNRRLARFGLTAKYNFMSGYIWETKKELQQTSSLMLQILHDNPRATMQTFNVIVPYPGTGYLADCIQEGMAAPECVEDWIEFNPDDWISSPPWIDRPRKELLEVLYIASICIDKKGLSILSYTNVWSVLVRLATIVYYPIAWLRIRFCNAWLPFEIYIFNKIKQYFMQGSLVHD